MIWGFEVRFERRFCLGRDFYFWINIRIFFMFNFSRTLGLLPFFLLFLLRLFLLLLLVLFILLLFLFGTSITFLRIFRLTSRTTTTAFLTWRFFFQSFSFFFNNILDLNLFFNNSMSFRFFTCHSLSFLIFFCKLFITDFPFRKYI